MRPAIDARLSMRISRRALALAAAIVVLLGTASADARPPPPGSAQAEDMAPYADAIRALTNRRGQQCCDVSDCRKVRAELRNDGHWWVLVTRDAFADGNDRWQMVPEGAIVRPERRPMLPWALACWVWFPGLARGVFQCFTPPAGA